ncbi:uncharacterized protein LOC131052983 isoform X1 [Cryptomeria japonica]|uniref:uncharacterized protein LOC131052983 isoform X1 n=1 Tax=Cryptomeria japonica TaxID=3369 RepID=UPI0027DAB417|nr:uncharacterized protein LOC131052983 isoform X1 [Cryptomeria japonica]
MIMAQGSVELEYQCKHDDAWYVVSVEMRGNELVVHYLDSGDVCDCDEILSMEEFNSSRSRFRLACRHLQDEHCDQVEEGMQICALYVTDAQETKFFDAIVKQVCRSTHCSIDDEDQCTCAFKVLWQAGPNACRITSVSCQNICLLTTGSIESHPVIREFVKLVRSNEQELSLDLNSMAVELKADQMNSHLSADMRREEDYSLSGHGGTKRSSSSLEEQKDGKIMEGNVGKRIFLHYSRGNVKQWTLKNSEMFTGGRKVQDYNHKTVNLKDSKNLLQHGDDLDCKVHIVKSVNIHTESKRNKIGSPESLPAVVDLSSDDEDDYSPSKKKCDYRSQNLNRQHDDHIKSQKELSTVDEIKADCTCICECHRNAWSRNDKVTIFRCNYEGQKNISAIQHHCNGHFLPEKSNSYSSVYVDSADMPFSESDHNLQRNLHFTCKECQKTSTSSMRLYSRPSQSNIRQSTLPACNQCRTYSGNTFTAHRQYFFHSSICRCNELPISDVSAFSEDEPVYDGAGTGHFKVSNGKHCRNSMKPMLSSERENMMIQMGLNESRCRCTDAGCEHCYEDVRTEERQFYSLEVLGLDNLEKDVNPFDVKEVITSMGCRVAHVHILPTLKLEQFTRGFVWFQDRASLMKALDCLQDDNFFVVSSNGRPWVSLDIDDGVFGTGSISEGFNIKSKYCKQCTPSKILVVPKGTKDFEKAKRRKNLFLEFKEQFTLLHKRLEFEEKMFNQS